MKIILVGFATSYKSSVGKILSKKLNIPHFDVDALVENKCGKTVSQIFSTLGEQAFRQMEEQVINELCQKNNCIISCGGGSVMSGSFSKLKLDATVVWLKVSAKTVHSRLNGKTRPLFDNLDFLTLQQKVEQRNELYQSVCNVVVQSDGLTSHQVADRVLQAINE